MYAKAGKEFVDVLFSFLTLPAAAIVEQALHIETRHCLTNLYNSAENMPQSLIKAGKPSLLQPKVVSNYTSNILNIEPPKYYICHKACGSGCSSPTISTINSMVKCHCGGPVYKAVNFVDGPPESTTQQGYVEITARFAIADDLTITPLNSTDVVVNLWSKYGVKETSEVDERNVTVGASEVKGLLKAAMVSSSALNEVFKNYISVGDDMSCEHEATRLLLKGLQKPTPRK